MMTIPTMGISTGRRRIGRAVVARALMVGVIAVGLAATAPPAAAQSEGEGELRAVGQLVRPNDHALRRPMAVDGDRSLGFVTDTGASARLHMMDLERLVSLGSAPNNQVLDGFSPESSLALDPRRERLYATASYPTTLNAQFSTACSNVPGLSVFDYRVGSNGIREIRADQIGPMPCSGSVQFYGLTNSYDEDSNRLYMGGVPATERWRYEPSDRTPVPSLLGGTMEEDRGQALLIRQLAIDGDELLSEVGGTAADLSKASQLRLEWEVDLRLAGCGRRQQVTRSVFDGFVARLGNDVIAYCWDTRAHQLLSAGQQGYIVRIPLVKYPDNVMRPMVRGEAPIADPLGPSESITNYVYRRVPTLPGSVTPLLDLDSGRVMLVSAGTTNGNAVWVFDPKAERFIGVITGGYGDEPIGNSAVGFDSNRGRVYVLTQHGVLVAPIRSTPLPAGLVYPVLANKDRRRNFVSSNRISVAPKLGRLFVAMNDNNDDPNSGVRALDDHYEVLEDHIVVPPDVEPIDPDSLTTGQREDEGTTASSTSGRGIASGAHVVNTGGLPRVVGQNDPTCVLSPPNLQITSPGTQQNAIPDWQLAPALFGSCLADMIVSAGHREASVAAADVEVGTQSGSTARGSALAFGSTDVGTDSDIRRVSDCGASTPDQVNQWGRRWPLPDDARVDGTGSADSTTAVIGGGNKKPFADDFNARRDEFWRGWADERAGGQAQYRGGCNQFQDEFATRSADSPTGPVDLGGGTKGPDGRGFPVPAAVCGDFGGTPSAATWPDGATGQPQAAYPTSSVTCDASGPEAEGDAAASASSLPSAADAQLTVARTRSRVTSVRTPEGQITVAYASASGIQTGPLTVAEIRSLAVTRAGGRPDTTSAVLVRQWCGIVVSTPESTQEQPGCVDATSPEVKDLLDELSAALLQKVQFSVPEGFTQATSRGYQAVVTKHPGQRGADQTVNDDDSHTVAALQAVMYADGPRGRSRLVVQLAGVHAESRYGIIELPNFGGGFEPEPGPAPGPKPSPEPSPVPDPGPAPAPPVPFTPETFFEEDFGVGPEEFVRFSQPPSRTVTVPSPRGNPLQQIVRVPVRALSDAINLLVQNPREAALLSVMWAMLAAPVYLGLRRRSFARALVGG